MDTNLCILLITTCVVVVASILFGIRNNAVFKERNRMIDRASADFDLFWDRLAELETHTYGEMLLKLWRPVKWFYREYD